MWSRSVPTGSPPLTPLGKSELLHRDESEEEEGGGEIHLLEKKEKRRSL